MAWRQHAAIRSRGEHLPVDKTIGTPPLGFETRLFRVSKPRGQYAHGCVEERIPVAPCRQRFELLGKPNARIAELNDGLFVVDDQETSRVEAL